MTSLEFESENSRDKDRPLLMDNAPFDRDRSRLFARERLRELRLLDFARLRDLLRLRSGLLDRLLDRFRE